MVEILLFAVLSVYLFYRLWSVLGTRTGQEKQRQWPRPENTDTNVIILPQKNVAQTQTEIIVESPQPFVEQIKMIKKSIKDFSIDKFQVGACNAFRAVLTAFAAGDNKRLEQLVSPKIAKEFQQAVKARTKQKETLNIDIKSVEAEIEEMHVDKSIAEILVHFTSDQIVTTLSKEGEIIDNTNQLTNRMIDRWTFQKNLAETGPAWLLVKTESVEL
ncbi:MAG: Tim44/TimA family putative adaptor protein [Proteobacteria bacterium]|nr:Tim44/TimA family putative adaptor protein [Pseudomonadota bacterium]